MTSTTELFALSGKRALITGGGAGLGYQMAVGMAEAGADVVLCGRNAERCKEAAHTIETSLGVRAIGLRCDVRDENEIKSVVETATGEFGGVDILVNNAGTSWGAPAVDYPLEGWRKVLDVNLTGLFLFTQAVGRQLIDSGRGGKIINLTSVTAFRGAPGELLDAIGYNASKGGVISLTRDLAVKWAPYGINVNAVAPGWFPTDMSHAVLERSGPEYLKRIPLGRFGGPDDLKGAAVFLASGASDFVTGQTLVVDGGQSIS
jgi:NAD(P)-dependent dehydrogenase (short-subunit alcohol dehydrogenase family)